jgi:hypothetical protein
MDNETSKGGEKMTNSEKVDSFAADVLASFEGRENVRPEEVASALQLPNGKSVRGFLRMTFPRDPSLKGTTWLLTNEETLKTLEFFLAKRKRSSDAS